MIDWAQLVDCIIKCVSTLLFYSLSGHRLRKFQRRGKNRFLKHYRGTDIELIPYSRKFSRDLNFVVQTKFVKYKTLSILLSIAKKICDNYIANESKIVKHRALENIPAIQY